MKRICLGGPMSGLPELNFPTFHTGAPNTGWHECVRNDLRALLDCDILALLDGWQSSAGVHLELHIAHRVGMEIVIAKEIKA